MKLSGAALAAIAAGLAITAAQLGLIGHVELTFDEAYYTLWSRSLAWGYLDHPPLIAAWIRASTTLFGPHEFGVRALNVIALALMPVAMAIIAWRLFGRAESAALAALFWLSAPLVAGEILATPDAPLVLFSTLALAGLVEAWRGQRWAWAGVGLALGLAGLSKLTAGFFGLGVVLALVTTPSLRDSLRRPSPYLAALLALAILGPFLAWNASHGWATLLKQGGRIGATGLAPRYLVEFLGSQIALINPVTVLALAAALTPWGRTSESDDEPRNLLGAYVLPAFLYFLAHSLHDRVQANWLAPLFPPLILIAADAVATRASLRFVRFATPALGLLAIAVIYGHAATHWPSFGRSDPLARVGGWRELTGEVFARAHAQDAPFILAHGYASTSMLTYYGAAAPLVLQAEERDRWTFLPPPDPELFDAPGLAFGEPDFVTELSQRFRHVEEIERLPRMFGNAPVQVFVLYRVSDPINAAPGF